MSDMRCALWYDRHHMTYVDVYDSEIEAASAALAMREYESGVAIGVQFPDCHTLKRDDWPAYRQAEAEAEAQYEQWRRDNGGRCFMSVRRGDGVPPDLWQDPERKCPDCYADVGGEHTDGCDVARCPQTGLQRLSCDGEHDCGSDVWAGVWPGSVEAHRYGVDLNTLMGSGRFAWDVGGESGGRGSHSGRKRHST